VKYVIIHALITLVGLAILPCLCEIGDAYAMIYGGVSVAILLILIIRLKSQDNKVKYWMYNAVFVVILVLMYISRIVICKH
jgi:hypothetical protein